MMLALDTLTALAGLLWAGFVCWLVTAWLTLRGIARQTPVAPAGDARSEWSDDAPLVSVLVPARNEEHRALARSVRSMLAQDYAPLEVIVVNDRSTDLTLSILREIATTNEHLRVIDGAELPSGWLGKPHALQQAFENSRGEWTLATDADMILDPRAVRTAVNIARAQRLDALTLIPRIDCESFWERVFMPTFGWFMLMALPLERVNDPKRAEALGVGGFFLIRRRAMERIGGYRAVRGEVVEDLRTAELLKNSGARLRVEYAPDLARTRMQPSFREIWEGFTKNLYAGARFSLWWALLSATLVFFFTVVPVLVLLTSALMLAKSDGNQWLYLLIPASLIWLTQVAVAAIVNRNWDIPVAYALTVPLGHALFIAILLNSAAKISSGRGVIWKGRRLYERDGVRPPSRNSSMY